jgi:hypothetical protein
LKKYLFFISEDLNGFSSRECPVFEWLNAKYRYGTGTMHNDQSPKRRPILK